MKVIIIEDELYNQRMLEGMLRNMRPGWQIEATFESIKQSVNWFQANPHPDLIFMDIQLSDGICFSIFDQVDLKSAIIFTTAYDNYAIRAFKVNSIDYLLKPIKEPDLEFAIGKFESQNQIINQPNVSNYSEIISAIREGKKEYRKRFMVTTGNKHFKVDCEDIAYFISENKITTAITFTNEKHVIDFSLERLEEELNPDDFFRTDRRSIVNINAISRFEDYFGGKLVVKLKSAFNEKISVSRLKASAFKVWVGK